MPEITVRVLAGAGGASAGINVSGTLTGFDHMSLVTAHRSRADAKDWYLRHTTYGPMRLTGVAFANTTGAYPTFNLAAALGAFVTDDGYRLGFGDLGKTFQLLDAAGSTTPLVITDSFTVPALSLPAPSLPIVETVGYAVREYSTGLQRRAATLNEHTPQHLTLEWRNASGERAHEIRAYVESTKGAGTVTLNGYEYTVTPGSLTWEQRSALAFDVSLELDLVQL